MPFYPKLKVAGTQMRLTLFMAIFSVACAAPAHAGELYTVVDGYKVDEKTLEGFRTWRASACDRCHGANQQGLVGPSLIESMKKLTKDEFVKTVIDGWKKACRRLPAANESKNISMTCTPI